jgi:membrane associated rhomboid family serine protease
MANAPRDRPGRPGHPRWVQAIAERMTPAIKVLVILNAAIYLVSLFVKNIRPLMLAYLTVGPTFRHEPWQALTAMFVHFDLPSIVFGLIGIWFVGVTIERSLGTRRLLALYFVAGILANVATGLLLSRFPGRSIYAGMGPAVLALFVAFGRIYGRTPTQILGSLYLKAHQAAILFVGLAFVVDLLRRDVPGLGGTLVVTVVGYLMGGRGGLREQYETFRARRLRQRYKVLDGGVPSRANKAGKYGRKQKYWN